MIVQSLLECTPQIIVGLIQVVGGIVKSLPRIFGSLIKGVVNILAGIFTGIKEKFAPVGNWIDTHVVQPVVKFFQTLWTKVKSVWDNICKAVKTAVDTVKTVVTNVFNAVKNTVSTVWNAIKNAISTPINAAKNTVSNIFNSIKTKISTVVSSIKNTVSNVFNSLKNTVGNIFNSIKEKMSAPIQKARDTIKGIVDKIKGFFTNMKISLPKIKLPHFKVTGKLSISPPSVPKLSIDWYKDGGIFVKPTIFSTATGLKGVGEAGAEAVLPIDKLEGYISGAIEKAQTVVNFDTLAAAIQDLAKRPVIVRVGDRDIAVATASANDSVNGLRSTFKGRGLALD